MKHNQQDKKVKIAMLGVAVITGAEFSWHQLIPLHLQLMSTQ